MAKQSRQQTTRDDGRPTEQQIRDRGGVPFVRPESIARNGTWFELTGFNIMRGRDTDDEQVVCEVRAQNGALYSIGIRSGSPDHRRIFHAFGSNFREWAGAVRLVVGEGSRPGSAFVNVAEAIDGAAPWTGAAPTTTD